jgi:hypothetical protein
LQQLSDGFIELIHIIEVIHSLILIKETIFWKLALLPSSSENMECTLLVPLNGPDHYPCKGAVVLVK